MGTQGRMLNFEYSNVFVKSGQNLLHNIVFLTLFCRMQFVATGRKSSGRYAPADE